MFLPINYCLIKFLPVAIFFRDLSQCFRNFSLCRDSMRKAFRLVSKLTRARKKKTKGSKEGEQLAEVGRQEVEYLMCFINIYMIVIFEKPTKKQNMSLREIFLFLCKHYYLFNNLTLFSLTPCLFLLFSFPSLLFFATSSENIDYSPWGVIREHTIRFFTLSIQWKPSGSF